jgi:PAS domain S-box-containing protein
MTTGPNSTQQWDDLLVPTGITTVSDDAPLVLHVDDDPALLDLAQECLTREVTLAGIESITSPTEVMEILNEEPIECIVSDYDMPKMTGLELLKEVRAEWPDLPFILFTGKGSETIASEAISAGVTDYLQKGGGLDQYELLANRVKNAISEYRAHKTLQKAERRFRKLVEYSADVISIVDTTGTWRYMSPPSRWVLGRDPEEFIGSSGFELIHPDDRTTARDAFFEAAAKPGKITRAVHRYDHPDGEWRWLESRARNLGAEGDFDGLIVYSRDITEKYEQKQELERKNERLERVVSTISHDLTTPLNVADAALDLARETGDEEQFERTRSAQQRALEITEDLVKLARTGETVEIPTQTNLSTVAEQAWQNVLKEGYELTIETTCAVKADESRLQEIFENLFQNVVEHSPTETAVEVGDFENGFFVADSGPGIPEDDRETVFQSGFSTTESGTGFGLSIVREIAEAHGWHITIVESESGGTRFEFAGVEIVG